MIQSKHVKSVLLKIGRMDQVDVLTVNNMTETTPYTTYILGIDPGLRGGLAFLNTVGQIDLFPMPTIADKDYDIQEIKRLLCQFQPVLTVLEQQIALPGQGLSSTLQTGKGFGILLGLLAGMEMPHQVVAAKAWQMKIFSGVKADLDTKAKSEIIAKRLFPKADFRKSDRARVAADGLTDAACIAEYGRRLHTGGGVVEKQIDHSPMPGNEDICVVCGDFIPVSPTCRK